MAAEPTVAMFREAAATVAGTLEACIRHAGILHATAEALSADKVQSLDTLSEEFRSFIEHADELHRASEAQSEAMNKLIGCAVAAGVT